MSKILYDYINSPISRFVNTREFKDSLAKVLCCTNTGGGIQSVVAGTNITVDNTDPLNPIINATNGITGTGTNNVLTKWTSATSLGNSLISEDATTVKIGAVGSQPTYAFGVFGTTNGVTVTGEQNALSLTAGNLSTSAALIVLRNNTSNNIAEFSSPLQNVFITASGSLQASALAGVGTRMVVCNNSGLLSTQSLPSSGWALPGNSGTNASTNFVGTTDNTDLSFRVNNNLAGFINISAGNTSFGNSSLPTRTTGAAQSAFGAGAMALAGASSAENSAFGSNALFFVNNGQYNAAFGAKAGETLSGNYNSAFGAQASKVVSGNKNIAIGYLAGPNIGSGNKNICISTEGNVQLANTSNQLNIGNVIWGTGCTGTGTTPAGQIGIGTIAPLAHLDVRGDGNTHSGGYADIVSARSSNFPSVTIRETASGSNFGWMWGMGADKRAVFMPLVNPNNDFIRFGNSAISTGLEIKSGSAFTGIRYSGDVGFAWETWMTNSAAAAAPQGSFVHYGGTIGYAQIITKEGRHLLATTTDDGVNVLQANGSVKATQFRISSLNTTPSSSSATGTTGEIRWDADYMYVCVATNTWKRSAILTW